jgi:hypothetical protein
MIMAQSARVTRRFIGILKARVPELELDNVDDPRDPRGRRWTLSALLSAALVGLVAGSKSLAELEDLTVKMSAAARGALGIVRRVPDTTLRSLLCEMTPESLRAVMHRQVRAAHRRKALVLEQLPFGVVALDGKDTALPSCDDNYAQRQTQEGGALLGVLRTMTCCLVGHRGQPCIDAFPIPASTNEMGLFASCVSELVRIYGKLDLFRMVATDAGSCSLHNATSVRELGLHYLFGLKGTQLTLLQEARRLLAARPPDQAIAVSEDQLGGGKTVVRRLWMTTEMAGFEWDHLKVVLRVQSQTYVHGSLETGEDRYFVCSLGADRLTPKQWLRLVRQYWGVENAVHCTLDKTMREDDHPWIEAEPQGALAVALLRRVAYTLLALARSVTLRSEDNRCAPWKTLIQWLRLALLTVTAEDIAKLRIRRRLPATAWT